MPPAEGGGMEIRMQKLMSKDKKGRILVNGGYKICNIPSNCSRNECYNDCVIDMMIKRLYELEHAPKSINYNMNI